jgi:alanine dehydrogenase
MADLLNMEEVMAVVEEVFRDHALGKAHMPPKVYIELEKGDFRAMPGSVADAVGVKWINVHPANRELGLPTVMGILICSDPDTAYPLAIMDATEITAYRTAATSANATKYLARSNSRTLGLIGAGRQAYTHIESHALVMPLDTVKIYDVRPEAVQALIRHFPELNAKAVSAEEAAASDVVCTLTPATAPVMKASWVLPGTHINAVGADATGKHELDPELLRMARVVVDDMGQACRCGEINVALCHGTFTEEQVWGTLGEIIVGTKLGRQDDHDITIFDSTGLAIEDIATGRMVYQKAKKRGGYLSVNIVRDAPQV